MLGNNKEIRPVKAVLFDLDDTLFDHSYSSRAALTEIYRSYPCFQQASLDQLESHYRDLLEETHSQVLQGRLSLDEARAERFRRLFRLYNETVSESVIIATHQTSRRVYQSVRQPVPGAVALLGYLKPLAQIMIVTNNLTAEQEEKLHICGLTVWVDHLVTAEAVGVAKPEPAIFEVALARAGVDPAAAVMVGDSWASDILGAVGVGLRAVWLNRERRSCPQPGLAAEIQALEPVETVARCILGEAG